MKLLSISTDRKIFEEGSAVRARQVEYAKSYEEMHIVVFTPRISGGMNGVHEYREISISPNCFVYPTRSRAKFMYSLDAARLGKFIAAKRGITHITCQDSSLTANAGFSVKKAISRMTGKTLPLEIQVHADIGSPNFAFDLTNKIRKAMALSYLPKADTIRVVSERIKSYLVSTVGIVAEKISVRPIAVDVAAIKNAPVLPDGDLHKKYPQFDRIVLMASRLTKEKNIQLAIAAWDKVLAKYPKAGLIIVGDGPLKPTQTANIIVETGVDLKKLYSYYKTADLFLNTSLFEGYGMTLVEAQAAGVKTISTDVGIAREVGAKIVDWDSESVATGIINSL